MSEDVPTVPWADFLPRLKWRQGEHVALIGPTGQGKTTLALELLPMRGHTVILATKPKDSTLRGLSREGYVTVREWPPPIADANRVILWPRWTSPTDNARQRTALEAGLLSVFVERSWCVFADDVQYLTDHLKMRRTLQSLWLQARSLGISVVAATQRPRIAPLEMFNQSTHLFLWQTADDEDLRRLGGLGGISSKRIRAIVAGLPKHHALYVNTRDGALAVTKAERSPRP
jgi:hypothetical protein